MNDIKTIVRILHGSNIYGTNRPESDLDYKSVHLPDGKSILLQKTKLVISNSTGTDRTKNTSADIDDESFALHKLFRMIVDGDTLGIELLFAPESHIVFKTPEWDEIVSHRASMLNRECKGFVVYCRRQSQKYSVKGERVACVREAKRLLDERIAILGSSAKVSAIEPDIMTFVETNDHTSIQHIEVASGTMTLPHWEVCGRKIPWTVSLKEAYSIMSRTFDEYGARALQAETNAGVDWKAVSHAKRVGCQALEILSTGFLTLPRPPAEAADLLAIKQGLRPFAEVGAEIDVLLDEVEVATKNSPLPETSDLALIDSLTTKFYLGQISQ